MHVRGILPSFRSLVFSGVALTVLLVFHPVTARSEGGDESKKRLRAAEKELDHLRDSLHEAQRELAAKSERIDDLEKELSAAKGRGKTPVAAKKRELGKSPGDAPAPPKKRRVPDPPKPSPALRQKTITFEIDYEAGSAVNYEGREKALAWVKAQLEANPAGTFEVVASANDRTYAEVNETIATNRARYLADYLILSGVPEDRFVSVTNGDSGGERRARITLVPAARAEKDQKAR